MHHLGLKKNLVGFCLLKDLPIIVTVITLANPILNRIGNGANSVIGKRLVKCKYEPKMHHKDTNATGQERADQVDTLPRHFESTGLPHSLQKGRRVLHISEFYW